MTAPDASSPLPLPAVPGDAAAPDGPHPERDAAPRPAGGEAFHLEEYRSLRRELERCREWLVRLEVTGVLAAAAVYSWLASSDLTDTIAALSWYVPLMVSALGGVRALALALQVRRIRRYLRRLEGAAVTADADLPGWERESRRGQLFQAVLGWLFWLAFIAITASAGYLGSGLVQQAGGYQDSTRELRL